MDYDDNDYQSQNFHIVGDDSSKVSSVLCPYALPKFDFDESLQGHLRFDSLVENEVFLGIPSQEDNQWIEEYSRGSSGIEFSPSAAESCSIPRRNNVWSEAASSESVEMLLKSVIQEHNLPVDAIIEESDAGNELGNLTQQMEPNVREDDKVDYVKDSITSVQPDEFSRSKETTEAEVIQMALETQVVETCAYENIETRENDQITTDDSLQIEVKNNDSNKVEVGTLDNEMVNQTKGNPSASGVQVQGEECSSPTVTVGNSSEWDKLSGIPDDFCKGAEDNTIVNEDTTINDEKLSGVAFQTDIPAVNKDSLSNVTSEVGVNEAGGENTITNLGESSSLLGISDHDLSTAEVCKKDVPFVEPPKDNKSEIVASPKATEIQHQYDDCSMLQEETSVAFKSTSAPDRHVAEVREVEGLETCSNLELEKCSALNIPAGLNNIAREQNTTESFISPDQRPSFASSGRLSEPFGPQTESSIDQGGECDSIMESSNPAGILEERHATEDLEGGNVCAGADKVVSGIGHNVSSLSEAECVQIYRENLPSELPVDACNSDQDNFSGEKGRAMSYVVLSNEEGDKSLDPQIGVRSSSIVEEHKEDVETTCAPEFGTSVQNKQASAVEVKDANCSSHDTVDNVNSLSKHSDVPPVMVNHPEQKPLSVKEGSMHFGNEEMNTICPKEASPSTLDSSVQMIVEASHIGTPVGQATAAADVGQDCSKIRGGQHDSTMREGTCDKTETIEKHKEANNDGQNLPKFGDIGSSVEPVAPSLVSPSATNCTQLLQMEKNKQELGNGATVESIPTLQATDNFVGKVQSTCMNSGVSASSKEERSLNIEVTPVAGSSEVEPSKDMQSFPSNKSSEVVMVGEELPLMPVGANTGTKAVQETPQVSDQITPSGGSKSGSERKTRRGSSKTGRKSTKGNQLKETPVKVMERRDKSRVARESSGTKTSGVVSTPTSNLPDLNTSTQSVLFQQPFTDLQQVQLRAQIFVYGSLIQGAVPDEACMVSAFGTTTDGGRSTWEAAWRACVERHHGQRSHAINTEIPVRSRSGAKTPDQAINQGLQQSKILSSTAARSSGKGSSTPIVTPMIPLSSPLWNIATPSCDSRVSSSVVSGAVIDYQSFSSLNPYQIPPGRNLAGYTTWLSQTSLPAPWVASPQTAAFDVSARFPVLPITEPVKLTPVKESSVAASAGTKHMPTNSMAPSVLSGILAGNTSMIDNKKAPASPADLKSRKRKKPSVTDGHGQISLPVAPAELVSAPSSSGYSSKSVGLISSVARSQPQTLPAPVVSSHFSTLVAVTTSPSFVPKGKSDLVTASSLLVDHSKRADINVVKRTLTSEDIKKVEEATLQAEEASAHAAAALGHCQGIWIELDKQKNSSLMPDVEAKLASAAVAIAAAASVAKAAAAAAKVASDAAAQVKQIADEALVSSKSVTVENSAVSLSNSVSNLGSATPASISKGGDGNFVSIEAMSAASRHAENLMAIVKAAELAAEALSHAGKVVMGDPLPLSELVKAGPDGFWKVSESMSGWGVKSKDVNGGKSDVNMVEQGSDVFPKQSEGPSVKALHALKGGLSPHPGGTSANTIAGSVRVEEGISPSILHADKDISSNKGPKTSEFNKTLDISTGPEIESRSTSLLQGDYGNIASSTIDNSIKEGCLVEVLRDSSDLKAWFSANVLSLKDGNAFISYTELQSDEGSGQLKEWIPLHLDGEDVPSIRISHPMTAVHLEGARKRRRAAVKDYTWSVGDRVDAWMDNCWREGIIIEKNKKDETILSVNFPARGDTAVVRAWNLRPTLIWKDGEWVEWSTSRDESASQGDTPKEKRIKLGNPAGETSGKAKLSKNIDLPEPGTNKEQKLLPLSDNEKIFNVGSNRDENKPNMVRTMRSGLQKEGSKVVFGVPKPGKKRKFMEVSKHYVSDWGMKDNTANDSAKFAKYVMPQGSGVGGWKNNSKTNPKEKEVVEFKSRPPKSRKPPSSSRTSKDNSLTSNPSASGDATSTDHVVKDTMSYDKNESAQSDFVKCNSNGEEAAEGHMQFSSEDLHAESTKKVSTLTNKSEKVNEGNVAPASGKSTKVEVDKSIPEVIEPRRSNRRIQPTSRLLEGLQSSLIITKFPSVSHDKGHRSHHRGTSKGNSHG